MDIALINGFTPNTSILRRTLVKPKKIILAVLMLSGILAMMSGCQKTVIEETEQEVIASIQRGDLSLDVAAVGNLALSDKQVLSFELGGSVAEVLVEEGDFVEQNQVLAKLDTSDRDDYLKTLTKTIELKDQALLQAEISLQNAENALAAINSQTYLDQKKAQAELDVVNAETALSNAEDAFESAEELYEMNWSVPERIRNYQQKKIQLTMAELNLAEAKETLATIESDIALEIEIKDKELVIVKSKFEDARKEYDDAVAELEEAQTQSWELPAPFAGYITKVNINEGQDVQKRTSAFELANPNEFEADVLVSEMDISTISTGTTATIQVDAMPSLILPAEVVRISPTASIQSGVVNYTVKVRIKTTDLAALTPDNQFAQSFSEGSDAIASGELPDMLKKAVEEGRMTQEQAEEMMEAMKSGNFKGRQAPTDEGFIPGDRQEFMSPPEEAGSETEVFVAPEGGMWQPVNDTTMFTSTATDFQLREGLTVTVSIFADSRTDVLLVPSGAVRTDAGKNYVTIVNADGTREDREIVIGLNDWQNTEVVSGLSEGEQVAYIPTTDSSSESGFGGMFMAPGGGGGVVVREEIRP